MQPGEDPDDAADGQEPSSGASEAAPAADAQTYSSPEEGDDVPSRNPDTIAEEIEQTRAELADTIDAIAERMNPKRAAARSAEAVKTQVTSARDRVVNNNASPDGSSPIRQAASAPVPVVPLAALIGLLALIALLVRRRRSH
jgi:hypothetical protein